MSLLQRCSGLSSLRGLTRLQSPVLRTALFRPARVICSTKLQTYRPFFSSSFLNVQLSPKNRRLSPKPTPYSQPPQELQALLAFEEERYIKTSLRRAKIAVGIVIALCAYIFVCEWVLQVCVKAGKSPVGRDSKADLQWFDDNFTFSLKNMQEGRYHTLLTSGFNHSGLLHIGFNMYTLWAFGPGFIFFFGLPKALGCYLGSIVAGSTLQYFHWKRSNSENSAVGASGGISGLLGAYAMWQPFTPITMFFLPMQMAIGGCILGAVSLAGMAYPDDVLPGLGHSSHLGGLIFGALWWTVVCRGRGRFGMRRH